MRLATAIDELSIHQHTSTPLPSTRRAGPLSHRTRTLKLSLA